MAAEKLVDGEFLAELVKGSYEDVVGAVDTAVTENAEMFGGDAGSVTTLGTYPDHVLVANASGDFFRARWGRGEDGGIEIGQVDQIDVPVYEASLVGEQVRGEARSAVDALLEGREEEAEQHLRDLCRLSRSGVRLTAEGVEDFYFRHDFTASDWYEAVRQGETKIKGLVGGDATRIDRPGARFSHITGDGVEESVADQYRQSVVEALAKLSERLEGMGKQIALARRIDESYALRGGNDMAADDFVHFVQDFAEDLDRLSGIVSDGLAVSEDGCVQCLARLHDAVSGQMYEWSLAALFAEKLARRFEPKAA